MLDKLEAIKAKFTDMGVALSNPEIVSNNQRFGAMSKEYRSLEKIVNAYFIMIRWCLLKDWKVGRLEG